MNKLTAFVFVLAIFFPSVSFASDEYTGDEYNYGARACSKQHFIQCKNPGNCPANSWKGSTDDTYWNDTGINLGKCPSVGPAPPPAPEPSSSTSTINLSYYVNKADLG